VSLKGKNEEEKIPTVCPDLFFDCFSIRYPFFRSLSFDLLHRLPFDCLFQLISRSLLLFFFQSLLPRVLDSTDKFVDSSNWAMV